MEAKEQECIHCKNCQNQQTKNKINRVLILIMFLVCVAISVYQSTLCIIKYFDYPVTVSVTEPDAKSSDYPLILICGPNVRHVPAVPGLYARNQFNSMFNRFNFINISDMEDYPWGRLPLEQYYGSLKPNNPFAKVSTQGLVSVKDMTFKPIYTAVNGICFYTDDLQNIEKPMFVNMVSFLPYNIAILSEWDFTQIYVDLINEWNIMYAGLGQLKMRYLDMKKKTRVEIDGYRCMSHENYNQIQCLEKCVVGNIAIRNNLTCTLPWVKETLDLPICNNYLEYKKFVETLRFLRHGKEYIPSCKEQCPERCSKFYYYLTGDDEFGDNPPKSTFILKLKTTISEVQEFPAYEFSNLMGDIGGIIGILLGFSALGVFKEMVTYLEKKKQNIPA